MARPSFTAISLQPLAMAALVAVSLSGVTASGPTFELVQPGLFSASGAMPNAWADFDNDGDLDEFVGFRGRPNRLYRQDHGRFEDVAAAVGLADNAETRAAAWGDNDGDGNIDLFVANQNGDTNGLFRNGGGHFVDVAREWGVDAPRHSEELGGVVPAVADFDGDGYFDLFVANYGPSALYRNEHGRRFTDVTKAAGLFFEQHATTPSWGDYDNDGRPDLYVAGFLVNVTHYPDHLFHNSRARDGSARFEDVLPALVNDHDASH